MAVPRDTRSVKIRPKVFLATLNRILIRRNEKMSVPYLLVT